MQTLIEKFAFCSSEVSTDNTAKSPIEDVHTNKITSNYPRSFLKEFAWLLHDRRILPLSLTPINPLNVPILEYTTLP